MFNIYQVSFDIDYSLETYKIKFFSNKKYSEKPYNDNIKIKEYIVCKEEDLKNIVDNYIDVHKEYIEGLIMYGFCWSRENLSVNIDCNSIKFDKVKTETKQIDFNSHKIQYWIDNLQASDLIKIMTQEQQNAMDILINKESIND